MAKLREYEHVHEHGEDYRSKRPATFGLDIFIALVVIAILFALFHRVKGPDHHLPSYAAPRIPEILLCSEIPGAGDIRLKKYEIVHESGGMLLVICDESNVERRKRLGYNPHAEIFEHYIDGFMYFGSDPLDVELWSKLPPAPRRVFYPLRPAFPRA